MISIGIHDHPDPLVTKKAAKLKRAHLAEATLVRDGSRVVFLARPSTG